MISLDLKKCNGCSACSNICPKKAIKMLPNDEGFLYPCIDEEKCINCEMCLKVCPLKKDKPKEIYKTFYGWSVNDQIRDYSSSGGVFWVLENHVIKHNGCVFGATYDYSDNVVKHIMVDNKDDLHKIMKSKYIQSTIGDTFIKVKEQLSLGRLVLFCGTPCQVNGLCSYLGKKYENLILVDFVCHGVPSPLVWKYHLNTINKAGGKIECVDFRDKTKGAVKYSVKIHGNSTNYLRWHHKDLFFKLFLDDVILRKSCYDCSAKGKNRCSDITISDFWGAEKYGISNEECKKGISLFAVYNDKIIKILEDESNFFLKEIGNEIMINKSSYATSANMNEKRILFFRDLTQTNYKKRGKSSTRFYLSKKIISKLRRIIKK